MEEEIKLFNRYFKRFDVISDINRKKLHSYRVKNFSYKIAKSLSITNSDILLAKKAALLHDVGRVPQFYRYNTFNDEKSIDHGLAGYELLLDNHYDNEIVLKAVRNHNKYRIDDNLSDKERLICEIVRDADKLDIMITQGFKVDDVSLFIPDEVYYAFKSYSLVNNSLEYTDSIAILRQLAFIFDLNFYKSIEMVNNLDVVSKKINLLYDRFNDPRLKDIEFILNEYVKGLLKEGRNNNYGRVRKKI